MVVACKAVVPALLSCFILAACAVGDGRSDARTDTSADTGSSGNGDVTSTDSATTADTTLDALDTRDTATADVRDVSTDTGWFCPATCTNDTQCQTGCPPPNAGWRYCCQGGSGGACVQQASACTGGGTATGGVSSPCTSNADCYTAPANCCILTGGSGVCGCTSFGICAPGGFPGCM